MPAPLGDASAAIVRVDGATRSSRQQQRELFAAWRDGRRWRGDNIAAYEPLSEPRVSRDEIWWVKSFYEKACGALAQADPAAACMVGSTPYDARLDQVVIRTTIYAFNFFFPKVDVMNSRAPRTLTRRSRLQGVVGQAGMRPVFVATS